MKDLASRFVDDRTVLKRMRSSMVAKTEYS